MLFKKIKGQITNEQTDKLALIIIELEEADWKNEEYEEDYLDKLFFRFIRLIERDKFMISRSRDLQVQFKRRFVIDLDKEDFINELRGIQFDLKNKLINKNPTTRK